MLIVLPVGETPSPLTELHWVQSRDGVVPLQQGQDTVSLLPAEADVVLAVPAPMLSWHWVRLPTTSAARLRQVLDGLLEDRLLADPAQLHLALQPGLTPGQAGWVCACDKAWLSAWADVLESAGRRLVRIVPEAAPQAQPSHGLWTALGQPWWVSAGPLGVCCIPTGADSNAGAAKAALGAPDSAWQAEPACAALAERLSGQPAQVQTTGQRLLAAIQGGWDLAQFDLRRSRAIRQGQQMLQALRALAFAPAWRAVRWGLLAAVGVSILGLWGAAWQAQQQLDRQAQRMRQLLTQTFPSVTLVLDAPLQMQREVERLQRASGVAGPADLETFLMDFSASSPTGIAFSALVFENGTVRLTLQPGAESAHTELAAGLQQRGWQVQQQGLELTARRAPQPGTAPPPGATATGQRP